MNEECVKKNSNNQKHTHTLITDQVPVYHSDV